jgi:hypothetical protein
MPFNIASTAVVGDVLEENRLPDGQIFITFNTYADAHRYLLSGVPKDAGPVMWVRAKLVSLYVVEYFP